MRPAIHVSTSAVLATAIYSYTHSLPAAAGCLASGVLIDIDHLADYHLFSNQRFTIDRFLSWCNNCRWEKMTVALHSYEILALLSAAAYYMGNALMQGMAFGAGLHLLLDQVGNIRAARLSPWYYFLTYRAVKGFRRDKLQAPSSEQSAGKCGNKATPTIETVAENNPTQ